MDKSKLLKDKELEKEIVGRYTRQELTAKIAEYLYSYTIKTKQYFSRESPKIICNVAFWLDQKDGQVMLMYNVHPKHWNVNKLIHEFEVEERRFLEHIGVPIQYDPTKINGIW